MGGTRSKNSIRISALFTGIFVQIFVHKPLSISVDSEVLRISPWCEKNLTIKFMSYVAVRVPHGRLSVDIFVPKIATFKPLRELVKKNSLKLA